jgi:antitoxin ParD1/3/4
MPITAELDARDQEMVAELVKSGRYSSAEAVLKEGLRLVRWREVQLAEFHAELDKGLASIKAGHVRPAEDVFDELIAKYDAMANQAAE